MWTANFWKATAERAIKTFAQALVALLVADPVAGLLDIDWGDAFSVSGLALVVSVLTSVASGGIGERTPSLTNSERLSG